MASPAARPGVSDRLPGLHPRKGARGRGAGQGGVPGYRRPEEGDAWAVAGADRGHPFWLQVVTELRNCGVPAHLHRLRRRLEGLL